MSSSSSTQSSILGGTLRVVAVLILILWLLSGVYVIKPEEAGVVRSFGNVFPTPDKPGFHYHLPYPLTSVTRLKVTQINSLPVGFSSEEQKTGVALSFEEEKAEFLTGDDNILHCMLAVQWSISDPIAYVVSSQDPQGLLRAQAETALMAEIGVTSVDDALTSKRVRIINNVKKRLSDSMDGLSSGIGIVAVDLKKLAPPASVAGAFKEVASAREDAARLVHEAEGYQNEAFPKARGQSTRQEAEASAYLAKVVNRANGEAERFEMLLTEYQKNPSLTSQRLYLETMDEVLPRLKKYVLGTEAAEKTATITLFMDEIQK